MVLLVDTLPRNSRNQGSINLGIEIASKKLDAKIVPWWTKLDCNEYDTIAFNVFYPTQLFNIWPFLYRNNIEPLKSKRSNIRLIAGGQGIGNNGILNEICDEVFLGEIDGDIVDSKGFHRASTIESPYVIKNNKAVVELTRGCKYRCKFCEYSWVHGGKYREKEYDLVMQQMAECKRNGIGNINFLSANFGGYSHVSDVMDFCLKNRIHILNSDLCLKDAYKAIPLLRKTFIKVGVESFDEKTRIDAGKQISDLELDEIIDFSLKYCCGIHFYLIYGLPGDNYDKWYRWLEKLSKKRKDITWRKIRFEFSITNFEPCCGTPFEKMPVVDFQKKHEFLKKWADSLKEFGYRKTPEEIWYHNSRGRFGRKELSYKLLMTLKYGGVELTEKLISTFPNGVNTSINDEQAEKFLLT